MMSKQRLLAAAAAALSLSFSACTMFGDGRGRETRGAPGDGSDTGVTSDAIAECKGLTGTALRNCLDRQGLNRATDGSAERGNGGAGAK